MNVGNKRYIDNPKRAVKRGGQIERQRGEGEEQCVCKRKTTTEEKKGQRNSVIEQ